MSTTSNSPNPHDLLRLNIPKADPIFRLLAAHAGFEDGQIPFLDGWAVFKVFMRLPSNDDDRRGTFQVCRTDADPDVLEAFFGRQLTEWQEKGWTRVVGLSYVFHPTEGAPLRDYLVEGEETWSDDFATLDAFFTAVEQSEGFRTVRSRDIMTVTFFSQEEVDDDLGENGSPSE